MNLKTKLTLSIALLTAILMSVLVIFGESYCVREMKDLVLNQHYATVSAVAEQLDDRLLTMQNELAATAQTLSPTLLSDQAGLQTFFRNRPDTLSMFNNGLLLFSPQGRLLFSLPLEPALMDKDFSMRPYLIKTLSTRRAQTSEPFISYQNHRHPIIMFTAPVIDARKNIVAVIGGSVDLTTNYFLGKTSAIHLGKSGYLFLFDNFGVTIAHPVRDRIMKVDADNGKAVAGFEGTVEGTTSDGVAVVTSYKKLKSTGWIVAARYPQAEAFAAIHQAQHFLLLVVAVLFPVAMLVVWLLSRHLTAPLIDFTQQIRAFTKTPEGSKRRIAITSHDEIAMLGHAFNTLLKELEAQKRELQAQLDFSQRVIDTTPVPIFYLDSKGNYLGCNKAFEEFNSISRTEVVGKAFLAIEPVRMAEEHKKPDLGLSRKKGMEVYETTLCHANGRWHDVLLFKAAFPTLDGSNGMIAAMLDVTKSKEAEKAHEQTRRQLQLILDAAGEGIYGVDMEGRVTFVNPAAAHMMGASQQEMLGVHQHSAGHHSRPDGTPYPVEECPLYLALRDGRSLQGDEVFWRKDGSSFPVEYIATPIRENDELVGSVIIFKDTSERKQVEDQLLKLSQAVEQSPISIVITDTAGTIEYVNPKFTEISGYGSLEAVGRPTSMLKSGETPDRVYRELWNTIAAGKVWSGEIINRHKNGNTYWEHATISPIRNSSGAISHYMAFKENMTERKRLEEQLRQAQKMEAVGQLAGGVAHDFNNILTVIMGYGQMLNYALPPDDGNRGHMEQILDAADRATQLTKSLLAFSRKQVMVLEHLDLNDLARRHSRFPVRVIGEDVTLRTAFVERSLPVLADSGQIEQVLMNLATNARDAMPGGGEFTICTEAVELDEGFHERHGFGSPGRYALITITDTGSGMDAVTRDKIFEPFFTTKEPGRGTGLGLSIVYGIVKQHCGYITISSEPGTGTSFHIYLPLAEEGVTAVRKPAALLPQGGKETILVVEDDPAVRRLVESVLKRFGYSVLLAESGDEAIELFEQKWQDIDLALMDLVLPKMNGKEICDVLRLRSPRLKVLFLSGYTADVIQDKGITVAGIDILAKPAKPIELAKKVRELLDAA